MKNDRFKTILNGAHRLIAVSTIVLTGFLASSPANAEGDLQCTVYLSGGSNFEFGTAQVSADLPIGGVIKTIEVSANAKCIINPTGVPWPTAFFHYLFPSLTKSTIADTFETGTPGIGVRVTIPGTTPVSNGWISNTPISESGRWPFSISLVKTANTIKPGIMTLGNTTFVLEGRPEERDWRGIRAKITAATCKATTPSKGVELPPVHVKQLQTPGNTAGTTQFNIDLTCGTNDAPLYITMSDSSDPLNRSNNLTLTSASTATGVQLRITKKDGTLVKFGPDSSLTGTVGQWRVGAIPNGALTIPMSVQYISTGTATPGTVAATATYTLSYQ